MAMKSLVTGGMTTRKACGRTTWRKRLPAAHAQRQRGFGLAARDGLDAGAVILGLAGGVVQAQAEDAGQEGVEPDADFRQAVVDQEKLDEQRRSADDLHIGLGQPAHGAIAVKPQPAPPPARPPPPAPSPAR